MRNIFIFLISIVSINFYAQSKLEIPNNYKETEIPKENSEEHRKLNYSEDISIKLNGKKIKTFKTQRKKDSEFKFQKGFLIGTDHGEWGGKLTFKINDNEIVIKEGNIFSIFEIDGKIYFMEGLAHGATNYGKIYALEYTIDKFSYHKVLELPDEPEVFTITNNKIYIATFENLLIIKDWKIEYKMKGFWKSLYPNSIIVENENSVFLGIRGGIVQILPNGNTIKLYTKIN
ncbi:hypothetical protein [Flavobacterium polysaccharolyticum]|uniref:Glutamine cyclotransferase n=1 Tax=Flavobacterium polysaccharolyticum TaxID=3133148 RepID=A0ABU9NJL6_9FLAO